MERFRELSEHLRMKSSGKVEKKGEKVRDKERKKNKMKKITNQWKEE